MPSTATIIPNITWITTLGDFIVPIFNTTAGQSTGGYNGSVFAFEGVEKAIDDSLNTKYLNFGRQSPNGIYAVVGYPGVGTGFIVTPSRNATSIACGLLFATANDAPERDPLTVTLEGSLATTIVALNSGASWTLIYNGSTGMNLSTIPPRMIYLTQQNFSNTVRYRSYRLLVTSQRGIANSVQYAEAHILGYF